MNAIKDLIDKPNKSVIQQNSSMMYIHYKIHMLFNYN